MCYSRALPGRTRHLRFLCFRWLRGSSGAPSPLCLGGFCRPAGSVGTFVAGPCFVSRFCFVGAPFGSGALSARWSPEAPATPPFPCDTLMPLIATHARMPTEAPQGRTPGSAPSRPLSAAKSPRPSSWRRSAHKQRCEPTLPPPHPTHPLTCKIVEP